MENKIRVKCSECGAVLTLNNVQDISNKFVVCPRCKTRNRLSEMAKVEPKIAEQPDEETSFDEQTSLRPIAPAGKASLLDLKTGRKYDVHEGTHLVGRRTYKSPSLADIPLETEDRGISRAHFYVDMKRLSASAAKVYIYNARNQNPTYVNSDKLEAGDKLVLHDGDLISSADTQLKFIYE